jgi:hypothetical protein
MIRGNDLEEQVHEPEHIHQVLEAIAGTLPHYLNDFARHQPKATLRTAVEHWHNEQEAYRDYLDLEVLDEFEYDAAAFKSHTASACPIIRRCLNSPSEVMVEYQRSFRLTSGRTLLDAVRSISDFARSYASHFDDRLHEAAAEPADLGLEPLNEGELGVGGVIGYGVQSCMLHGVYPREFALRTQDAVWALYFLSERQDFGLADGSEFLMVYPDRGFCEQNYFYPAQLFGFYALKVFLVLREFCGAKYGKFDDRYRYIYLNAFLGHVAEMHRTDINALRQTSEYVENQPWRR